MIDLTRRRFLFGVAATPLAVQAVKHFVMPKKKPWTPLDLGPSLLSWYFVSPASHVAIDDEGRVIQWKDLVTGAALSQPSSAKCPTYSAHYGITFDA